MLVIFQQYTVTGSLKGLAAIEINYTRFTVLSRDIEMLCQAVSATTKILLAGI